MSESEISKRLTFYAMLAAGLDDNYAECSCGHHWDGHDDEGYCLVAGCGCAA